MNSQSLVWKSQYLVCKATHRVDEIRSIGKGDSNCQVIIQRAPIRTKGKWVKFPIICSCNESDYYICPQTHQLRQM